MAHLQLKGLRKSYGEIETLHGIDLDIEDGEFIVFVGPSPEVGAVTQQTLPPKEKQPPGSFLFPFPYHRSTFPSLHLPLMKERTVRTTATN